MKNVGDLAKRLKRRRGREERGWSGRRQEKLQGAEVD